MAMIHVSRAATSLGAFSEEDVREGLRTGRFLSTDLGWREGMPSWQPLSQFGELSAAVPAAPPPQAGATPMPKPRLPRSGLPWERRREIGFVSGFFETVALVLTGPGEAFNLMRTEGGFADPLLFGVIGGCIAAVVWALLSLALHSLGLFAALAEKQNALDTLLGASVGGAMLAFRLILTPIFIAVGLFIWSGLVHFCLLLLGGANKSFEASFRALSYAYGATSLFVIVPCCGWAVAMIWGLVADCIGIIKAHETDTGRAVIAVFLPFVMCCGFGLLCLMLIFGGIGALMQHVNQ